MCAILLDTNILVHQTCSCISPLQCTCLGGSGVTYVLSDMDLFCVQGETLTGKYLKWAKEKFNEPAGTKGLKATEVCLTHSYIDALIPRLKMHIVIFYGIARGEVC